MNKITHQTKIVGIITSPGYPNRIAERLKEQLPDLLSLYVSEHYHWEIVAMEDAYSGGTDRAQDVLEETEKRKKENDWSFTVCLTDLPLFKERKVIVAEANEVRNVAVISLPSFGSTLMIRRLRESILQLISEMYYGTSDGDRDQAQQAKGKVTEKSARSLMEKRFFEFLSPIQRETPTSSFGDVRFVVKKRWAIDFRLISGMVRANRPWSLFPAFMKVLIFAFTTGAYALVFPTLWQLSTHYSAGRMAGLSIISIIAMVLWIVSAHSLWEGKRDSENNYLRKLYNTSTFSTLLVAVCLFYLLLFCMFSLAVFTFIPMSMLESQLSGEVSVANFFYIAWTATSIATIVGALGSALEDEEVVLSSTYGYRQRMRQERLREKEEEGKS